MRKAAVLVININLDFLVININLDFAVSEM